MIFDNKTTEELATTIVKQSILFSPFLQQYILENDKTPIWDGHVYIYNSSDRTNKNYRGRVAVQIKGTVKDDITHDKISYPVDTLDMRHFLTIGGTMYFVVYIAPDGERHQIYYSTLTPVKINTYLDMSGEQDSKSIEFKPFPSDGNKKANIFINFYDDCKKQTSFLPTQMLDDVNNYKDLSAITMSVTGFDLDRRDPEKAFLENEIYLYGKMGSSDVQIPIKQVIQVFQITHEENQVVSVAGKQYYNSYQISRLQDEMKIYVGKSLVITINNETRFTKIDYKPSPFLRNRVIDSEFFLDALNNKGFMLGSLFTPLEYDSAKLKKFDPEKVKSQIEYFKRVLRLFTLLNITKNFDIEKATVNEWHEIDNLMRAFLDNQLVSNLKPNLSLFFRLKIQDIIIMLFFVKEEGEEGTYRIYDFFSNRFIFGYDVPDSDEKFFTSNFSVLTVNDYIEVDNIDYDRILPSYQALVEKNPKIYTRANLDMLNILSAYDKTKNEKLLRLAEQMADWIFENGADLLGDDIAYLNIKQIARRQRDLTLDEIQKLYAITENGDASEEIKVGAYLLLGNQLAAQMHFNKIAEDIKAAFKEYPIFYFWQEQKEDTING